MFSEFPSHTKSLDLRQRLIKVRSHKSTSLNRTMLINHPAPKPKCNDAGFAIFFVISLLCNAVFAISGISQYGNELFHLTFRAGSKDFDINLGWSEALFSSATVTLSMLFSILWLFLCTRCGNGMIKGCLIAELVLHIVLGFICMMFNPFMIIPFLIFAVLRAVWMYFIWGVIPFCQSLFSVALSAFRTYWHPILVHLVMVVISFAVLAMDLVSMFASNKVLHFQNGDQTALFSFGFVQIVFLYWHYLVFQTVAYCTSCGVMIQYLNRQRVSTMAKFGVSFTTLFGSICMGTLIEAVIMALRYIAQQRREEAQREGNMLSLCGMFQNLFNFKQLCISCLCCSLLSSLLLHRMFVIDSGGYPGVHQFIRIRLFGQESAGVSAVGQRRLEYVSTHRIPYVPCFYIHH